LVEAREEPSPPSRDRPGRVYQSHGSARSAVEGADLHEEREEIFLVGAVERLAAAVRAEGVRSLVVVAPPRAIGVLRRIWPPEVKAVLAGEIVKDLARLSTDEITRHLAG
jgi:protein required for attachment to host cells